MVAGNSAASRLCNWLTVAINAASSANDHPNDDITTTAGPELCEQNEGREKLRVKKIVCSQKYEVGFPKMQFIGSIAQGGGTEHALHPGTGPQREADPCEEEGVFPSHNMADAAGGGGGAVPAVNAAVPAVPDVPHRIRPEDAEACQSYLLDAKAQTWAKKATKDMLTKWHNNPEFKHLRLEQLKYQYRQYVSEVRKRRRTGHSMVSVLQQQMFDDGTFGTESVMKILARLKWYFKRLSEIPKVASMPDDAGEGGGGGGADDGPEVPAADPAAVVAAAAAAAAAAASDVEFIPVCPTLVWQFLERITAAYNHSDGRAKHGHARKGFRAEARTHPPSRSRSPSCPVAFLPLIFKSTGWLR